MFAGYPRPPPLSRCAAAVLGCGGDCAESTRTTNRKEKSTALHSEVGTGL